MGEFRPGVLRVGIERGEFRVEITEVIILVEGSRANLVDKRFIARPIRAAMVISVSQVEIQNLSCFGLFSMFSPLSVTGVMFPLLIG